MGRASLDAPLQSIQSAPAADVGDSQQKCSNLMEWGGELRARRRAARASLGSAPSRSDTFTPGAMKRDATRAGRARSRRRKNTLVMRDSLAIYEARCPGVVSHGAREDVEAARRRRPKQRANENKHHPHRDTASPPACARRPSRGCATQQRRRTNSRPFASSASS